MLHIAYFYSHIAFCETQNRFFAVQMQLGVCVWYINYINDFLQNQMVLYTPTYI